MTRGMVFIAAANRYCAQDIARTRHLSPKDWLFVTNEWVLRGHTESTIILAPCWRPDEYESSAVDRAVRLSGATTIRVGCP